MSEIEKKIQWLRIANWAMISVLAIRAIFCLTWSLRISEQTGLMWFLRFLGTAGVLTVAAIAVFVWANQTDMDKTRLKVAIELAKWSTLIILACGILARVLNNLEILLVKGPSWFQLGLWCIFGCAAAFLSIKEKQLTDKKLSKFRTPPKKTHKKGKIGDFEYETEEWIG
jgi:hypothetical protein